MNNNVCDTVSKGSYFAQIMPDDEPGESPRDCDNLGTMVCFHNRYNLGDQVQNGRRSVSGKNELTFSMPEYFTEWLHDNKEQVAVILPLFLYDHSGISMSTGREYPFNCPWDSGQVGYIFVTKEAVRKEYSCKHITKKTLDKVREVLQGEVKAYDQYLTGDVYGYKLFKVSDDFDPDNDDPDDFGGEIESCWGFYGLKNIKEEVNDLIKFCEKKDAEIALNELEATWLSIPAAELVAVC